MAALLALVLVVRVSVSSDPFAGVSASLLLAGGALALLAAWILASVSWSHAPARGLIDFDRVLLYLLALVVIGSTAMTSSRLRWVGRGIALACLAITAAGVVSRLLPHVWPTTVDPETYGRLAFPITYWNAVGLVGALGTILWLHLTCSEGESRKLRVVSASAPTVLAVGVYLTFSRGAIAAGSVGLLVYVLLARPRLLPTGLVAAVPPAVVALIYLNGAGALTSTHPTGPVAVAQGQRAAVALVVCAAVAAALRAAMLPLDVRLLGRAVTRCSARRARAGVTLAVGLALVGAIAAGAPAYVNGQYDRFVSRPTPTKSSDLRDRLVDPSNNGRIDMWRVATRGLHSATVQGAGAGTFELMWDRHRPDSSDVFDAHSLYVESLGELGIVGLVLVVAAMIGVLAGVARRVRGADRALYGAVLAVLVTWALRAGVDWDWEMPVVTLVFWTLGGAALATPAPSREPSARRAGPAMGRGARLAAGVGCLVIAVTPLRVALSQRDLNAAARAFGQRDCAHSVDASLDSVSVLALRPEPYELLAYCDVRLGETGLALKAIQQALDRDPGHWEYHYVLALVRGAAGEDPLPAAREAERLNPREELARDAVRRFTTRDRRLWRSRALTAALPPL